jgi:hypothetical protein
MQALFEKVGFERRGIIHNLAQAIQNSSIVGHSKTSGDRILESGCNPPANLDASRLTIVFRFPS